MSEHQIAANMTKDDGVDGEARKEVKNGPADDQNQEVSKKFCLIADFHY